MRCKDEECMELRKSGKVLCEREGGGVKMIWRCEVKNGNAWIDTEIVGEDFERVLHRRFIPKNLRFGDGYRNVRVIGEDGKEWCASRDCGAIPLRILYAGGEGAFRTIIAETIDGYIYHGGENGVFVLMGKRVPDDDPLGWGKYGNVVEMRGVKYETDAKLKMGTEGRYPQVLKDFVVLERDAI